MYHEIAKRSWKSYPRDQAQDPPPEFVVVCGDIVDFGAGSSGARNYDALYEYGHLYLTDPGNKWVLIDCDPDTTRVIPVFFTPGNHDYRSWKFDSTPENLDNYKDKLLLDTYYYDIVRDYAIFSINSGHDEFADAWILPEGSGLYTDEVDSLIGDLNLPEVSDKIKIIMMHHTHDNRMDRQHDGEFMHLKDSRYIPLLSDYSVDFALYGHKHKKKIFYDGDTKCYICKAAEEGCYYEVPLFSGGEDPVYPGGLPREVRMWSTYNLIFLGDLEVYAHDAFANRTGIYYSETDTLLQLDIPNSIFHAHEYYNDFTSEDVIWNEILVRQEESLSYTFTAEAKSNSNMTIVVEIGMERGEEWEITYEGVPMYYDGGFEPPYSVATLSAAGSEFDSILTISDPGAEEPRLILPTSRSLTDAKMTPAALHLHQNYPNPFNPSTTIAFDLPAAGDVKLCIYNVKGELVSIVLDEYRREGWHRIVWDGTSRKGDSVASGIYFYRLTACGSEHTRKMVLLR